MVFISSGAPKHLVTCYSGMVKLSRCLAPSGPVRSGQKCQCISISSAWRWWNGACASPFFALCPTPSVGWDLMEMEFHTTPRAGLVTQKASSKVGQTWRKKVWRPHTPVSTKLKPSKLAGISSRWGVEGGGENREEGSEGERGRGERERGRDPSVTTPHHHHHQLQPGSNEAVWIGVRPVRDTNRCSIRSGIVFSFPYRSGQPVLSTPYPP